MRGEPGTGLKPTGRGFGDSEVNRAAVGWWEAPREMQNLWLPEALASGGSPPPHSQHSCVPFGPSLVPGLRRGRWLGVKSACQLRQESLPGTGLSQHAGEENVVSTPYPCLPQQLPELKPLAPPLLCLASPIRPPSPLIQNRPGLWPGPFWL